VLVLGVAQAATIRIAHSVGSKDFKSVRNVVKVSVIFALTIAAIFSLTFFCFPRALTDIFIDIDNNQYAVLAKYAKQFFLIAIFLVFFDVLQILGNNILRGLKDTVIPMFFGISSYWIVGILMAYLLAFKWGLGGVGIWYGIVLGLMVSAVILWWRWFYVTAKLD
jgi:MATE family multidrug resistance protein